MVRGGAFFGVMVQCECKWHVCPADVQAREIGLSIKGGLVSEEWQSGVWTERAICCGSLQGEQRCLGSGESGRSSLRVVSVA